MAPPRVSPVAARPIVEEDDEDEDEDDDEDDDDVRGGHGIVHSGDGEHSGDGGHAPGKLSISIQLI